MASLVIFLALGDRVDRSEWTKRPARPEGIPFLGSNLSESWLPVKTDMV